MKNINYWSENKKNNNVVTKLPNCAAKDYYSPSINKILTKIVPDNPDFVPVYNDYHKADIKANTLEQIKIHKGGHSVIDCGFSLEVPLGYKICASTNLDNIKKGIFIRDVINENNRIKILIINNGQDTLLINNKDVIGQIYIEPVYFFEWEIQ
jgi:dUTPase